MRRFLISSVSVGVLIGLSARFAEAQGGRRAPGDIARTVDMRPEYPGAQGSSNVKVLSHIPLPSMANIEIEQDMSRPYAYLSAHGNGFQIINLKDPTRASVLYSWSIENPEVHVGSALDGRYAKLNNRYYYIQSFEFQRTGPDAALGAIVFDVTGLPDTTKVKETARIYTPEYAAGFHSIYAYKHSDGRALLLAALPYVGPYCYVYDMAKLTGGDTTGALIAKIPRPDTVVTTTATRYPGYHDFYVHYDVAGQRDLFFGAGLTGYYVFDITDLANPKLISRVFGTSGMDIAHTFTPDPTGRYAVTEMEYATAPLRIFDLKPDGKDYAKLVSRPVGAWTANWKSEPHNHEVRWPYVFVSGYNTGLQIFNMMDPTNPYTVGYHIPDGASTWGVDVRNADGLIVTSGYTGFWAYKLDGFDGWNGHQWGLPNVSRVQVWDIGPDGDTKRPRVSGAARGRRIAGMSVPGTERLYFADPYVTAFHARVVGGDVREGHPRVALDRSAFYPEGGGQPADHGTLAGVPVLDVQADGDVVWHSLERSLDAPEVEGTVDWPRRLDHIQQHHGQHLLSAAFDRLFGFRTVSFHLGPASATIDLSTAAITESQLAAAEDLTNQVIWEDRPVLARFVTPDELAQLPLRKPPVVEGAIRIVSVPDFDHSACGGTHPRSTGVVGLLHVRRTEKRGSDTRVEFLCGGRAVRDLRAKNALLARVSTGLTVGADELEPAITRLREAEAVTRKRLEDAMKRLAGFEAAELAGQGVVCKVFADRSLDDLKLLANRIVELGGVALLGLRGDKAQLVFASPAGSSVNAGALLKEIVTQFGGKGGGQVAMAQGGIPDATRLEGALEAARRSATGS